MGLEFSLNQCNRLGGILAIALYLLTIGVFMARLANRPGLEHWLGLVMIILTIPLAYLLVSAFYLDRPGIYFLWIGLMILYLPGLLLLSQAALLLAAFNHLYIWVHYYCTEKPDMKVIFS